LKASKQLLAFAFSELVLVGLAHDLRYSRMDRTASKASCTTCGGAFSNRSKVRARASTVLVWSQRMTP
jgi:hypothetical protein